MTGDQVKAAIVAMGLDRTRPMDLLAGGKAKEAERLRSAANDVASHLMMAEEALVNGEVEDAHRWLVKARWRLADEICR